MYKIDLYVDSLWEFGYKRNIPNQNIAILTAIELYLYHNTMVDVIDNEIGGAQCFSINNKIFIY